MGSADWFAKKLGGGTPTPQQQPGLAPTSPAPARAPAPQQQQQPANPDDVEAGEPGSLTHALAVGETRGGPAHKMRKIGMCPGCGSGNYFQLKNGESCFDCGYPLIQFGSELGEGSQMEAQP